MDGTIILNGILCDYRTRKPILTADDSIATIAIDSVVNANISVMDSSAPKPLTPRQNYLASLALGKGFNVLTDNFRAENEKAVLSGIRGNGLYTPPPSNGGVES